MSLYEITNNNIIEISKTLFKTEGFKERSDIQRLLRDRIEVVVEDVKIISEEFGSWDESRRRIDLLGIDKDANLVVIELKRTTDGGHMELQAIQYAAMLSGITFDQAVKAHESYLQTRNKSDDAQESILDFLGWDEPDEEEFNQDIKIVLVSADFGKELTTSILWLIDRDIDIRCIRVQPYSIDNKVLLDVQQVLPLKEAAEYQIRVKEKKRKERSSRKSNRDTTKFDVTVGTVTESGLPKRRAMLRVVQTICESGVSPDNIHQIVDWRTANRMWRHAEGKLAGEAFRNEMLTRAKAGEFAFTPKRWFHADDELIYFNGSTYSLHKSWGPRTHEAMEKLIEAFPEAKVAVTITTATNPLDIV